MAKKEYRIPVLFTSWGLVDVEADNLEEAIEIVDNGPIPTDSEYVDSSFRIDYDGITGHNDLTDEEYDELITLKDDLERY